MASLLPSGSKTHQRLPSPPPSPGEADLATGQWVDIGHEPLADNESAPNGRLAPNRKGKAREAMSPIEDREEITEDSETGASSGYPPTLEEEEESRKVEENLKRWEQAERSKRKAARESAALTAQTSIIGDVGRRASLLWPGSKSARTDQRSLGVHTALNTNETEDVALHDIDGVRTPSPSRPPSPATPTAPARTRTPPPRDDPFHDSHRSAVTSTPPGPSDRTEKKRDMFPDRSLVQESSSLSRPPPPAPAPLDIPPPRTPPPRIGTPGASVTEPPSSIPRPAVGTGDTEMEELPQKEARWWTDWLCGCREGPDRGGDHQAGRTNPFE